MAKPLYDPVHRNMGKLLSDVIEGSVGLPDLQRPFVWKNDKVRELLDSMMKGYPIGYIMLWESPDDYEDKKAFIGENEKNFKQPKELVIDGQQRLTALLSSMHGISVKDKNYKSRRIMIAYDPLTHEFHNWDASIVKNASYIPDISEVFKAEENKKLSAFRKEYIKRLNEANEKKGLDPVSDEMADEIEAGISDLLALSNYLLPTLVIGKDADEEKVSDIFVRVNSQGQSLKQDDFIMTLLSVYEPEMRNRIEEFCAACTKPEHGTAYNPLLVVTATHIIRATVALGFSRGRLRYAYSILRGKDLKTKETSAQTRAENFHIFGEALDRVLNLNSWHAFINALGEAGFINGCQVTSENAAIFSYALYLIGKHRFNMGSIELKKLVRQWFYMSTVTSRYAGSFESQFEAELTEIKNMSTAAEFEDYLRANMKASFTDDYFAVTLPNDLDANEATGPTWWTFVASQIVQGAKVFFGTMPISQLLREGSSGTKNAFDKHHLFPDNFLKQQGYTRLRSSRANFVCLDYETNIDIKDKDPQQYVAELRELLGEEVYMRTCEDNALPLGFENMNYEEFLAERRVLMAQYIRKGFECL